MPITKRAYKKQFGKTIQNGQRVAKHSIPVLIPLTDGFYGGLPEYNASAIEDGTVVRVGRLVVSNDERVTLAHFPVNQLSWSEGCFTVW